MSTLAGNLAYGGLFTFERWSPGGVRRIWRRTFRNGITTAGLNYAQETCFRSGAALATWYAGLIDNTGYSALAAADTMSSHAGWTELTDYNESTRQQWSPGAASNGVLVNASAMTFTFSATKTLKGGFIVSNSTKGGTTGTLWATGLADSALTFYAGEIARVTYSLTAAAGAGS